MFVKRREARLQGEKGNQGSLREDLKEYFSDLDFSAPQAQMRHISYQSVSTHDQDHGRIEGRDYTVSDGVERLVKRHPRWKSIRLIGIAESNREAGGQAKRERRHFISRIPADAEQFAATVRAHWGIENSLHYVLDAAFGEDGSRLRKESGPENMAVLRKTALTAARSDTETKSSIIGCRKQTAWSNEYLEHLLFQTQLASKPG